MEQIKLNLGCGKRKQDGYINIDNRREVEPDMIYDLLDCIPYPDNSVDEIRAYDFLEHIPIGQTIKMIEEIYRVLKPFGFFEHFTPSTDGRGAYQDPTHVSFWNFNSWSYYTSKECNIYNIKALFGIITLEDIVKHEGRKLVSTYGLMYKRKIGAKHE